MNEVEERKDANRNEMDTDDIELNGRDEDAADETNALDGEAEAADGGEDEEGCFETEAEDADGEDGQEEAPAGNEEEGGGKKFFKKKVKTDKKQDALKQKVEDLEDRVKRQMAEFDNFRKRSEKEKTMMFETGARSVIEKILPVVDNFERGLASVPEEQKADGFAQGMEMIYKQLMTELEKMEVKPIPAVGEEFNPDFHNAVMQVESEEYESGVIAQELQKGYTYRDGVVRHSMVAVVN